MNPYSWAGTTGSLRIAARNECLGTRGTRGMESRGGWGGGRGIVGRSIGSCCCSLCSSLNFKEGQKEQQQGPINFEIGGRV